LGSGRTSESRSLSWRLLAGYEYSIKTTFPLKRKRRKREREENREKKIATAGQLKGKCAVVIYAC